MATDSDSTGLGLVNPRTKESGNVIWRWIRLTIVAVANVIVLGLFAAYFQNQALSLLDIIEIIANSMGIILGFLGIWFYFVSEQLNRTTAINLERTTIAVSDLAGQMWNMIQTSYNRAIDDKSREDAYKVNEAIAKLEEQSKQTGQNMPSEVLNAIQALSNRIDTIDKSRESLNTLPIPQALFHTDKENNLPIASEKVILQIVQEYGLKFPMPARELAQLISLSSDRKVSSAESLNFFCDGEWFVIKDSFHKARFRPSPSDIIDLGPTGKKFADDYARAMKFKRVK